MVTEHYERRGTSKGLKMQSGEIALEILGKEQGVREKLKLQASRVLVSCGG